MTSTEKTIEQHREEFEEWYSNDYQNRERITANKENRDCYNSIHTAAAWQAWQAARGAKE